MIRDVQQHNEKVTPKDSELDLLMAALPVYFDGDGNFKMEQFQNMLQEEQVELSRESYELNFLGKSFARLLASLETETVIVPNEEHNADERNMDSENIYITGDNLDALKHLAKSYRGKVKCIYIDPPYNTGKDGFIYNDSFNFTPASLAEQTGVTEQEAERILDLQGKSSHSAWLTFMLPRLVIAKTLLTNDGVIFVSIDDNENSNLQMLMDEIFGEQNFVSEIIVQTNPKGRSQDMYVATSHEYLFCYSSRPLPKGAVSIPKSVDDVAKDYKLHDEALGPYRELELRNTHQEYGRHNRPNLWYPFYSSPDGGTVTLEPDEDHTEEILPIWENGYEGCWTWDQNKATTDGEFLIAKKVKGELKVYRKNFAFAGDEVVKKQVKSIWFDPEVRTEKGQMTVDDLFKADGRMFQSPKPVELIKRVISMSNSNDDIVLDFFSGSGTTAQAVMELQAEGKKDLRYTVVQLGEEIDPDSDAGKFAYAEGYRRIDEVARKRIELAADKIKKDTGADIDYGFKHYTLETPPQSVIDSLEDFAPDDSLFSDDPLESLDFDGTTADNVLLTTWIVQDGYGLNPEIEKVTLSNYELTVVGNTAYSIDGGMSSNDIRVLTQKLEDGEIDITNFVYFHTAIDFERLREPDSALRHLRNRSSVTITARW